MIKKVNIIFVSALILIIGLSISLSYNMARKIENSGGLALMGSDFTNGTHDLSARILNNNEETISTYTTTIEGDVLQSIGNKALHIVIFRLNAQAYSIYLNGEFLDNFGDMGNAKSHIYNSVGNFSISKDKIKDTNILEIKVNALYMVGLENSPIGIVDGETARKIEGIVSFRTQSLTLISIGILLLGIIISILMIYLGEKKNAALLYFMLAVVFLTVYSLDFMQFTQLFIPYIFFKKIIIFSLFASIFFLGISFSKMFETTYTCVFSSILFALITLSVIFIGNIILFKRIYDILIPLISVNFILWIFVAAKKLKQKDEAILFLFSYSSLLAFATVDSLVLLILGGTVSTSIFSYVMVFSMILISLLYIEINRRNLAIEHETLQSSRFYQQAITDPLTGAFNLKHTMNQLSVESPPYTLIMIDIDNFKEINDDYGHPAGDYILKYLVKKMQDEFRDTDVVGRYGGDEFIVILRGCSEKNSFDIMNRFRMNIAHDKIRYGNGIRTMKITLSIGIAHCNRLEEDSALMIKQADKALYRAKLSGKNQVSI